MPLTRKQKEAVIEETSTSLKEATAVVMVAYDAMTVAESSDLREKLFESGGKIRVVPKRLLKLMMANMDLDVDPTEMEGQIAVAWGDDPVEPAKVLNDFAKRSDGRIRLMAGTLEGSVLSMEEVMALATLPSRDQLIGQLLSVMVGPIQGTVRVMAGVQTSTVRVLQAIADKKQDN